MLARDFEKFKATNTVIISILADKMENAKILEDGYAKNKFPIHYDIENKVGKMLKQETKILKMGRMPALLIVDKEGVIRYTYHSSSMSDIPKNEEVFDILKDL
ncbi:MAG: peroxiredoxin family protein [archaeon]|nr:peroxiredoxin family protein [archaeon]